MPAYIGHGYAVGFPEVLTGNRFDDLPGHRVAMPHTFVLAELSGLPIGRFTLGNQMKREPRVTSYSGMSGGPIFWTDHHGYGLIGIVYEGGYGTDDMVYVSGELATPDVIKAWLEELFSAASRPASVSVI